MPQMRNVAQGGGCHGTCRNPRNRLQVVDNRLVEVYNLADMDKPVVLVTTAEAAMMLHKSVATVNRMAIRGDLEVAQQFPGATGGRLFDRSAVVALEATS